MSGNTSDLEAFYQNLDELNRLGGTLALLHWDQSVTMPPEGAEARAKQTQLLSVLIHQRQTSPEFVDCTNRLYSNLENLKETDKVNVRETKRLLDRNQKLPEVFVGEKARLASLSYTVWKEARPKNDVEAVLPNLKKLVELNRQEAELVGYSEHPYDALLDVFEPGAKLSAIKPLLINLGNSLREIIPKAAAVYNNHPSPETLPKLAPFSIEAQKRLCRSVVEAFGFSFSSGRLDKTAHPFASKIGLHDVRITTRYFDHDLLSALYSSMHEAGHALYELGFLEEHEGTPMAADISLGIHESQSRLWENLIGRSREFCSYLHQVLKDYFPDVHRKTSPELLWYEVNRVRPSLIRVEADEVTYSLHIVIRLLLEEALVSEELTVEELPIAWNELYEKYLGKRAIEHSDGFMQDVHWFQGAMGYFPTYALGNLYGAMLLKKARKDIPEMDSLIGNGSFQAIKKWLNTNVHEHGMKYQAPELIQNVCGEEVSESAFISYIKDKFNLE